jgi:succinyl-CoA synthetase beta subunit
MNIHEYQAKAILRDFQIPTPQGVFIDGEKSLEPQLELAQETLKNESVFVVKAQIHAGGRGKAGGVKLVKNPAELKLETKAMLQKTLITPQTGAAGKKVKKVLIEQGLEIQKEFYVSVVLDRSSSEIVMMVSTEGGTEIEEVALHSPEKITQLRIDPTTGFMPFHGRSLAYALGLDTQIKQATAFFSQLYACYWEKDCSLIEINPMVLTKDQKLIALDAKFNFDDNALYRHPDIKALRDTTEENPADVEASLYDLAYIALEGNIGCLVNGAGLAMATMDIIKLHGGEPANFLDVGGGASEEKVRHAFQIILKDPQVKGILVNIFGGIMKCDVIAEGIIAAAKETQLKVPLIVRLEGTNVELGKQKLSESGLKIIAADSLADAAKKAVQAVKGA